MKMYLLAGAAALAIATTALAIGVPLISSQQRVDDDDQWDLYGYGKPGIPATTATPTTTMDAAETGPLPTGGGNSQH